MNANTTINISSTNARARLVLLKVIFTAFAFFAMAMPCMGSAESLPIDDAYAQSCSNVSSVPQGAIVFVGAPGTLHDRHRATRAARQARRSDRRNFAETIGERLEPIFLGLIIL